LGLSIGEILKSTGIELLISSLGGIEGKGELIIAGVNVSIHVFMGIYVFLHLRDHLTCNLQVVGNGVEASIGEDEGLCLFSACLFGLEIFQEGEDFTVWIDELLLVRDARLSLMIFRRLI
jgi:hypothetical protein